MSEWKMLYWCFPHRCSMEGPGVLKGWRGAWSYGEVVGTAHFWSPVHLKCILNTFLWILGIEL